MLSLAPAVYILCLLASTLCAYLLIAAYGRTEAKVLLWSGVCFSFLALNNLIVVLDWGVFPNTDLLPLRHIATLLGIGSMIYGFIWETD